MSKKTTWWIVLILVGVMMSMAGALRSAVMIEASQSEGDLLSILSDRFCSRICLEAEEEAADPVPGPPPPPIISDRFCSRICLEAEEAADPMPGPPPPPSLSDRSCGRLCLEAEEAADPVPGPPPPPILGDYYNSSSSQHG